MLGYFNKGGADREYSPVHRNPAYRSNSMFNTGTASFTVAAAGTGLTYQWRLNGVNLVNGVQGNGSTVSGATTNTLSLSTLTTANTVAAAAGYDCIVSGTVPQLPQPQQV